MSDWARVRTLRAPALLVVLAVVASLFTIGGVPAGAAGSGLTTQTVAFTSTAPSPATVGSTYSPTAVASSGLPAVIGLDSTSKACTIAAGLVTFTMTGACVLDADQAGDTVYRAAPRVKQRIVVSRASQTVTFTSTPPAPAAVGATYTPTATASSGLAVALKRDPSSTACSMTAGLVTFIRVGTCVLDANQAGDASYLPAVRVTQSITVSGKQAQTVSFTSTAPAPALVGSTYTPTATSSSGLPVTIKLAAASTGCSLSGGVVSFTGVGTCVVKADRAGNATYTAAPGVQQIIEVVQQTQTIEFTSTAPTSPTVGDGYTPTATATSGLDVAVTLDPTSTGCTLDTGVVTFTAAGICVIDADQAGDATYASAMQVQQSIVVAAPVAPTAVADSATVARYSGANTINVLANDIDPDGGTNTITDVTQPANGTVAIAADGQSVMYTPAANYCNSDATGDSAADAFVYTLNGGSSATVSVKVVAPNDAPNNAPTITGLTKMRGSSGIPSAITDYPNAAANTLQNNVLITLNASASYDPAACSSGTLSYHWALTYPGQGEGATFTDVGITGTNTAIVKAVTNSLVVFLTTPGVTITLTARSSVTGITSTVNINALVTQSSLTDDMWNTCQAGPDGCTISAARAAPPDQAPTDITLSNSSIAEHQPAGTIVGMLDNTDPDDPDGGSYQLATGDGADDNDAFTITGNYLRAQQPFDVATKSSYSIRVRVTDWDGRSFEKQLTITVTGE